MIDGQAIIGLAGTVNARTIARASSFRAGGVLPRRVGEGASISDKRTGQLFSIVFRKDGYTDLRGKFDYAGVSLPTDIAAEAPTRYAILLTSESHGSEVRIVPAPKE